MRPRVAVDAAVSAAPQMVGNQWNDQCTPGRDNHGHAVSLEPIGPADTATVGRTAIMRMRCSACQARAPGSARAIVAIKSDLEQDTAGHAYWICAGCNNLVGTPIGWLRLAWLTCRAPGVIEPTKGSRIGIRTTFPIMPCAWNPYIGFLPYPW